MDAAAASRHHLTLGGLVPLCVKQLPQRRELVIVLYLDMWESQLSSHCPRVGRRDSDPRDVSLAISLAGQLEGGEDSWGGADTAGLDQSFWSSRGLGRRYLCLMPMVYSRELQVPGHQTTLIFVERNQTKEPSDDWSPALDLDQTSTSIFTLLIFFCITHKTYCQLTWNIHWEWPGRTGSELRRWFGPELRRERVEMVWTKDVGDGVVRRNRRDQRRFMDVVSSLKNLNKTPAPQCWI